MGSKRSTVDAILDAAACAGAMSARKMFGEYGLYCDGALVALVCDDQLFLKPTEAGRAFLGEVDAAPPYPGAKPAFRIAGERWDDADWLANLVRITKAALPPPKEKKRRG